jgi:delta-aminolevulinic acid dehydratase/porphobilinogen synthase
MITKLHSIFHSFFQKQPFLILPIFIGLSCASAQKPISTMPDTVQLPPNTIQIIGYVKKVSANFITIQIVESINEGSGIVNTVSAGQTIEVIALVKVGKINEKKINALLKEKIGIDASQSSYSLLRYKEQ